MPFDRLDQALIEADLVISTTAATEPIVTLEQYVRVQRARRNRLALILDIAIPRDFDPRIGEPRPGDALSRRRPASAGRAEPARAAEGDRPGAGDHRARDGGLLRAAAPPARRRGYLLQQLGNHADQIRQRELAALYRQPAGPDARPTARRSRTWRCACRTSSSTTPGRRCARPSPSRIMTTAIPTRS